MCLPKAPKVREPEKEDTKVLISRRRFNELMINPPGSNNPGGLPRTGGFGNFTGLNIPLGP